MLSVYFHVMHGVISGPKVIKNKAKLCSGPASRVQIVNVCTVDMQSSNKQE